MPLLPYSYYKGKADQSIRISFTTNPRDRASAKVLSLLNAPTASPIDVHCHFFDMKCINEAYFLLRRRIPPFGTPPAFPTEKMLFESTVDDEIDEEEGIYQQTPHYNKAWNIELQKLYTPLSTTNLDATTLSESTNRDGINPLDVIKMYKFLFMDKMETVYQHYIDNFSLATAFGLPKEQVITTALMMDLKPGWGAPIEKSAHEQIDELKQLSIDYPVLPFLFCDPRRAKRDDNEPTAENPYYKENLYSLFDHAFSGPNPFFGVKIYPCLGYDPSDYRLWPIYELCEKYSIPVLSHHGGDRIAVHFKRREDKEYEYFKGDQLDILYPKNRKDLSVMLNDPARWRLVLEKFPKLKLNIAHFGGDAAWSEIPPKKQHERTGRNQKRKETILQLMRDFPHVYADFSYNIVEPEQTQRLKTLLLAEKEIRSRTLFGTDYWVVGIEGDLQQEQQKFLAALDQGAPVGNPLATELSYTNPHTYLFQDVHSSESPTLPPLT